jgi:multiple sugar transport system permease protein
MAEQIIKPQDRVETRRRGLWRLFGWDALLHLLVLMVLISTLLPIWWILSTSFKREADFFITPPTIIFSPTLNNFQLAVFTPEFVRPLVNSLLVSVGVGLLALALGSLAAHALARYRFRGARLVALAILSARLIPSATMIIPYFTLFRGLGLIDTVPGLILAYTGFTLPFASWMMYGFFLDIPTELQDAALVDGCTDFQVFWRIALPLTRPGLGATFILVFLAAWNEFLYALTLSGRSAKTLPVYLASFVTERTVDWGALFAIASTMIVPAFVLALVVQGSLVRGLTAGAVKG